ncbi:hypothetical protein [Romeriopsis navalis]|uniref:hypothetical protein n=1 Tax=Romeriopsis navalis TaxID=2992132 RepID=UPI0021F85DCB|nr:hypothetical protein [Romeriopsis navalis]
MAALLFSWQVLQPPIGADAQSVPPGSPEYEIWGSDQSNSVSGAPSRGVSGSFLWVWDSGDMQRQLQTGQAAQPIGCDGQNVAGEGPCDLHDVFPNTLAEYDANGSTGKTLKDLPKFGRLHGMLPDPQNRYMNANIFAPGGGYVGIIDGETKEAVALFRVAETNGSGVKRSVHMSFWNSDGSALLVANLHGKILERIDVVRNWRGKIIRATFNESAALGVGKNLQITDQPKVYLGKNGHGNRMVGTIKGKYGDAIAGNLTPNGICKENNCEPGKDGSQGGRPNNVIICPIVSENDNVYITFGGGGLLVADSRKTPMQITGEYDNQVVNGAGCGGVQVRDQMWLDAGVSASGAGATQSAFTIYRLDDRAFSQPNSPNTPAPQVVFKDATNTKTIGNLTGAASNETGQRPGETTRRDSHGMARTLAGRYVHTVDRIQNTVEVFDTFTLARTTYDLTSENGQGQGVGPCAAQSVSDDPKLAKNDPAPDLLETTPDGKFLAVALRGPVPVSVGHSGQGSCPGVGIIELTERGALGRLAGVLRTTNTVDNVKSKPGEYAGAERSDVHGAAIRRKSSSGR